MKSSSNPTLSVPLTPRIAECLYSIVVREKPLITSIITMAAGFLLGMLVNAASEDDATFSGVMSAVLDISYRQTNLITWLCLIIVSLLPFSTILLRKIINSRTPHRWLAKLSEDRTDPILKPFSRNILTWGSQATLQIAPDIQTGWPLKGIEIIYDGSSFVIPKELQTQYKQFFNENFQKVEDAQDGTSYALVRSPSAFSDAPRLKLELLKTKYSVVQFYRFFMAPSQPTRDSFIRTVFNEGQIQFPSSLCMHGIVITRDKKVLVAQRSHKVNYYPNTWSVSVEEQLSSDDFKGGCNNVMIKWAKRFLLEELGLEEESYDVKNFRVLSVFLEADILNCSLAAILRVEMSSSELNDLLIAKPRIDYEFNNWKFYSYPELGRLLKNRDLQTHPSTEYRIVLALINRYGASRFADILSKS